MSVYRLYDKADALLYVGITTRGVGRLGQHAHSKPWWRQVARVVLEHHRTRTAALKRERFLIVRQKPRYNVALVSDGPLAFHAAMSLGKRIRETRERRSWGQAELARAAGIRANTLWKIEHGQERPRPSTVRKIAEVLGVDVALLLGGLTDAAEGAGGHPPARAGGLAPGPDAG